MSKIIAGKSPNKHFTPISNTLIRNSEIDDSTFRFICWMTSHDEGFEVNFATIQISLGYGRDKLRKILKNAEIHNYLVRRKFRSQGGLYDFEYYIFKDTEDAIAFRKSLPPEELTSDLFSGGGETRGGRTRGGLTRGGSTGGGRTRGGESGPLKEEQYREEQIKEEQKEEDPLNPHAKSTPTQENFSQLELLALETKHQQQQDPNREPKPRKEQDQPQIIASLSTKSKSLHKADNPSSRQKVAATFDKPEQTNKASKVTDEDLSSWFLSAYSANKPSNFTEHRQISAEHLKKIRHLVKDFPDTAIEMFTSALTWVREQSDAWWRQKQFSLDNLMTNGKIVEYADKHATAMKYDPKYRLRVEGKTPSMDKGRFSVVDDNGNESTGATADIARLYATDPMFRMLMEAGK